jgi:hypothetical protein
VLDWENSAPKLRAWGYEVTPELSTRTLDEIRRFLADWTERIDAQYCMVSLTPEFQFPDSSATARIIEGAIMPHGREHGQAVRDDDRCAARRKSPRCNGGRQPRAVRRERRGAALRGLSREQVPLHDARAGRSARALRRRAEVPNLHVFGCWWFLNNPSLIEEITRMRLELIGLSCTPQHSDCRVLDQLIYKWSHSRPILAKVLGDKYADLAAAAGSRAARRSSATCTRSSAVRSRRFCASKRPQERLAAGVRCAKESGVPPLQTLSPAIRSVNLRFVFGLSFAGALLVLLTACDQSPKPARPAAKQATASQPIEPRFKAAREQILAGDYAPAAETLTALDAEKNVPQPLHNWITLHLGLAELLAGRNAEARAAFARIQERGAIPAEKEHAKLPAFFVKTAEMMVSEQTIPVSVAKDYDKWSYEAFALMLLR